MGQRGVRGGPGGGRPVRASVVAAPKDVRELLGRWSRRALHPGLLLDRFLLVDPTEGRVPAPARRETFREVMEKGRRAMGDAVGYAERRADALAGGLRSSGFTVADRTFSVGWRFTIGLGGAHPTEVGFTLHRMGFPYLPASGLKGLARAVAEARPAPGERIAQLFGTQDRRGALVFLDGLPLAGQEPYLELDVMNPHVAEYYRGDEPWPREWLNPVPLHFLTVCRGVRFRVMVAARARRDAQEGLDLLVEGLTSWGAAAKRAAGYGWMEVADEA